jgi:hypothetical protein
MNPKNPPRIANWMMEHLRPAGCDEALAGDLLEHVRNGRSPSWYWLQVIAALVVDWSRRIWQLRAPLLFAAIWSLLSPAWILFKSRYERHHSIIPHIWLLPWPWSWICDFLSQLAVDVLFIWLGVSLYVVLCRVAFGRMQFRRPKAALLASFLVYAILWVCVVAGSIYSNAHFHGTRIDGRTLTVVGMVKDFRSLTQLVRFQYFAATAAALWFLSPGIETSAKFAA